MFASKGALGPVGRLRRFARLSQRDIRLRKSARLATDHARNAHGEEGEGDRDQRAHYEEVAPGAEQLILRTFRQLAAQPAGGPAQPGLHR